MTNEEVIIQDLLYPSDVEEGSKDHRDLLLRIKMIIEDELREINSAGGGMAYYV